MFMIFYIFFLYSFSIAQVNNSQEILNKVRSKFDKVNDYQVLINVKVDMEFLRIPNVSAIIYFEKPDKMKVKSDDFAVLPKEAINFSPANFLDNNYSIC